MSIFRLGRSLVGVVLIFVLLATAVPIAPVNAVGPTDCPKLEEGDLFRVHGTTSVYYVGPKFTRYYFPNPTVYYTWFKDFSGVKTIPYSVSGESCVDLYPVVGNINVRPGSFLVKTPVSPTVYAVGPGNMKHKIKSEEIAEALYGKQWYTLVLDISDAEDASLKLGYAISEETAHNGQIVRAKEDLNGPNYYIFGNKKFPIDGKLPVFLQKDVRRIATSLLAPLTTGDSISPAVILQDPTQTSGIPTAPLAVNPKDIMIPIDPDVDHIFGDPNAPITIVEYCDFEGPYCKIFHKTLHNILAKYPGDVRWVYRHFPLTSLYPNDMPAAHAAECAGDQNKFWEMADMLFEKQPLPDNVQTNTFLQYGAAIGLDSIQFNTCFTAKLFQEKIDSDAADAIAVGSLGTPNTIVFGPKQFKVISGAEQFEQVDTIIGNMVEAL